MDTNQIKIAASCLVEQATQDIREKIECLKASWATDLNGIAMKLDIPFHVLYGVINDGEEMALELFFKVMAATGHVVEIKPLSEAAAHFERHPEFAPSEVPFFDRIRPQGETHRTRESAPHTTQPRDSRGRFMPRNAQAAPSAPSAERLSEARAEAAPTNTPNFRAMSEEQLIDIIQNKLWDSEIDVDCATKNELVAFLEDKDRQLQELKARRERQQLEGDPKVVDLKNKIKKTLEENPNLKEFFTELFR